MGGDCHQEPYVPLLTHWASSRHFCRVWMNTGPPLTHLLGPPARCAWDRLRPGLSLFSGKRTGSPRPRVQEPAPGSPVHGAPTASPYPPTGTPGRALTGAGPGPRGRAPGLAALPLGACRWRRNRAPPRGPRACAVRPGRAMTGEAVRELLQRLRELQSERVETYRLFEEGHRAYLSSAPHYDFPRYRQLVHEVTVAFSGISREVLAIAGRLRDQLGRPDLAQHLARLQDREQEKLQLTAQLQLARQQAQDQPDVGAHQQEVQELKHKLIKTIEAISEILQDLKYDSEEVE
nr:required for excision 1-B domain-containing protein [Agelaius phoeniceus]